MSGPQSGRDDHDDLWIAQTYVRSVSLSLVDTDLREGKAAAMDTATHLYTPARARALAKALTDLADELEAK